MTDAARKTVREREGTHGDWESQAQMAQNLKQMTRDGATVGMSPENGGISDPGLEAIDMICVKMSRILTGNANEPEHWLDIAGYATLEYNRLQGRRSKDVK